MVNWIVKAKVKRGAPSSPRPRRRRSAAGRGSRRSGIRPGKRVDRNMPGEQARQQQVAGTAEVLNLLREADDFSQQWINQLIEVRGSLLVRENQFQATGSLLVDSWLGRVGILGTNRLDRVWFLKPEIQSILFEPSAVRPE
jgi:hypothetical protein